MRSGIISNKPTGWLAVFILALVLAPQPVRGEGPIDLNTASANELQQLPGIGPVLSRRIVEYRETNGPFQKPEDITRVFGLGEKKYTAIKDLIVVKAGEVRAFPQKQPQKINLNTASQAELETLPGIGPVKARRIIEYREEQGRFMRPEELMEVWGIGPKTFESMKNLVTVKDEIPLIPSREKAPAPSGPLTVKCWKCGKTFTVDSSESKGACPHCGADWQLKR